MKRQKEDTLERRYFSLRYVVEHGTACHRWNIRERNYRAGHIVSSRYLRPNDAKC